MVSKAFIDCSCTKLLFVLETSSRFICFVVQNLAVFLFRCSSCETVLHGIEKQIERSNSYRDTKATQKTKFESEVCLVLVTGKDD